MLVELFQQAFVSSHWQTRKQSNEWKILQNEVKTEIWKIFVKI